MKKKVIQSFLVVFSIGLLLEGVFFLSREDKAVSEESTGNSERQIKVSSSEIESIEEESSEESSENTDIPDNYIFDRTLFNKDDVTMVVDSFQKKGTSLESYAFSMALASNVFPDIDNGQTTSDSYTITADNIKVVTDTGVTLTGKDLYVEAGDSYHTIIESREWDDIAASDVQTISYTFETKEVNEIQISLVDDEGNEMIVSDWIEVFNTTADIFTSPEIFSAFLISEGANQIEQYLFQQVVEPSSNEDEFKYFINFNEFTESGMAPPGESYGLSKDGKVYTFSTYEDEGRDWRYNEEWTNKIANFDQKPWVWGEGVKEQVINSLTENGYIEDGNYYFVPNKLVDENSYAYDVVIIDEEYGYNPIHIVNVNNKTGDYHG
ncbi:MAG: cell division site-positioning protein MapZ family protein [Carnobacterium sp.]|uniref:cell division site-positioning protein MapZ family protein n=1 Tax=Carnobacterium sp. TaxID=48221 RepID=UPI0033144FFD